MVELLKEGVKGTALRVGYCIGRDPIISITNWFINTLRCSKYNYPHFSGMIYENSENSENRFLLFFLFSALVLHNVVQ